MTVSLVERGVSVILLDVEGTTTPISFVYDVLFPYARGQLRDVLRGRAAASAVAALLRQLRDEHRKLQRAGAETTEWLDTTPSERRESAARFVEWLMDRDSKSPALKELQGIIWADGYKRGELKGEVFPDVPESLKRWHDSERMIAIYSSGSILAQQLIFENTAHGDLTQWLTAFFDTGTGVKTEVGSYELIADRLMVTPDEIIFVSDSIDELRAAEGAGAQTLLCVRPGNKPVPSGMHFQTITSFDQIA